jgi:formiminoglutamase
MDIFEMTVRAEPALFYSRSDPDDVRFGDVTAHDPNEYDECRVVIFGCPQDEGVRRNLGRTGATRAPTEIRRAFYKLAAPASTTRGDIFDLGDLKMSKTLEQTHAVQADLVEQVLMDDKMLVVLGGGNDISYPDCTALHRCSRNILAFNIDSHFDVRDADHPHSGTPYRQLLEEGILVPENFYEMGSKPGANPPAFEQYLKDKGVHIHPLDDLRDRGIDELFRQILSKNDAEVVFWGFDIDAVRAMDAPGVSAPYPIGLTAEEICEIAKIAGEDKRSRIMEISEVNPQLDPDNRTSRLAAMMILYFITSYFS